MRPKRRSLAPRFRDGAGRGDGGPARESLPCPLAACRPHPAAHGGGAPVLVFPQPEPMALGSPPLTPNGPIPGLRAGRWHGGLPAVLHHRSSGADGAVQWGKGSVAAARHSAGTALGSARCSVPGLVALHFLPFPSLSFLSCWEPAFKVALPKSPHPRRAQPVVRHLSPFLPACSPPAEVTASLPLPSSHRLRR